MKRTKIDETCRKIPQGLYAPFLLTTCSAISKSLLERLISRQRGNSCITYFGTTRAVRNESSQPPQPKWNYLSVRFNEDDRAVGGVGKDRRTPLSTRLYLSSEDELRALFNLCFSTLD